MESQYLNLNYRNKFYVVQNTSMVPELKILALLGPITITKFQQFALWIVESGIYQQIKESVMENKYLVRKFATQRFGGRIESYVDKVRIQGSIQTLFFISLLSSILCTLVFGIEYGEFAKSLLIRFQHFKISFLAFWNHFSNSAIYNKLFVAICNSKFVQKFVWNQRVFVFQWTSSRADQILPKCKLHTFLTCKRITNVAC